MANKSKIEWTLATWNPVTGCNKISAGCKNCYAERLAFRLKAMGNARYKNGFEVTLHEDILNLPRKWKASKMIFVNSMSDLFHNEVPLDFIQKVFSTMRGCPQHIFQILTKRSRRLCRISQEIDWPENVWMGVTVENEKVYSRIDDLRKVPASVRFLSCEPLLSALNNLNLADIHWVIAGGESGPGARPINIEWVRSIRQQCQKSKVAFFFKQWGGVRKDLTGRVLDGHTYSEIPLTKKTPHQMELLTSP